MIKINDIFLRMPFIVSSKPYYEKIIAENEARRKLIEEKKGLEERAAKRSRFTVIK